jgi:hypothetical protein
MKRSRHFLLTLLFTLLVGCGGEKEITKIDNPEDVAIAFFDALYNQKDVKKAASVCSPQLARIIHHYKSPTAVGRHLFNMSFESVKITPDDAGVKVRKQFKDDATITLYFEGIYNENKLKDIKKIHLVQYKGMWVIDKILKDPF